MKSILLSTIAALSFATAAVAADLPARTAPAPVVPVAPVFTWSGFYVGVHGGYIRNDSDARLVGDGGLLTGAGAAGVLPTRRSLDSDGLAFGGQVGANAQFGQFVVGIEADIAYTDIGRTRGVTLGPVVGFPTAITTTVGSDIEYLGTVRGRLGFAVNQLLFFGPTLIYVTGGLAYGEVDNRVAITSPGFADVVGRRSDTEVGYALGFGTESRLTNNISLMSDTIYYDLGRQTVTAASATRSARYRFQNDGWVSRIGLNFRF